MKLGLPADPRAQKFYLDIVEVVKGREASMRSPTVSDAAETAAAHNDPDSWVVVQHCAKRILERLTRPPRVDTANLGPRVFAYRVRDAIGQLGEILTYERDDMMLETQREGKKGVGLVLAPRRAVASWYGYETHGRARRRYILLVHTNLRGRSDAISSGALTIACELRCALVAVDFLGSGGSQDAGASFGYWERYDLFAAVRYAKRQFPSAKIVLWGGAPTGAVALCLIWLCEVGSGSEGHDIRWLHDTTENARLRFSLTSDQAYFRLYEGNLVDDVVALVDERFRKRTGVGSKPWRPRPPYVDTPFPVRMSCSWAKRTATWERRAMRTFCIPSSIGPILTMNTICCWLVAGRLGRGTRSATCRKRWRPWPRL